MKSQMLKGILEGIIDSHHSRTKDKCDVLHEMMTHLYESEGESFKSLFGKQPENYALELGTSMEKGKSRYWKDFGMLFAYYTFIYSPCVLIAGSFTVSWLLLALPLLIALMIPMMNKGIRQQAFKGPASQTSTTITFLLLFGITKVFILFTFHDYFSPFYIVNYEGGIISVIKIACFILLIAIFFITFITSRRISMKLLFSVVILLLMTRIFEELSILKNITTALDDFLFFAGIITVFFIFILENRREHKKWKEI